MRKGKKKCISSGSSFVQYYFFFFFFWLRKMRRIESTSTAQQLRRRHNTPDIRKGTKCNDGSQAKVRNFHGVFVCAECDGIQFILWAIFSHNCVTKKFRDMTNAHNRQRVKIREACKSSLHETSALERTDEFEWCNHRSSLRKRSLTRI